MILSQYLVLLIFYIWLGVPSLLGPSSDFRQKSFTNSNSLHPCEFKVSFLSAKFLQPNAMFVVVAVYVRLFQALLLSIVKEQFLKESGIMILRKNVYIFFTQLNVSKIFNSLINDKL